jgi:hypothetical protein
LIDEAEGVEKLEGLQEHQSEEVYRKAVRLLETYFGGEEDAESENIAPLGNGNAYSFGGPASIAGGNKAVFNFNNTAQPAFSGDLGLF